MPFSFLPKPEALRSLFKANWKSGLTVAFISVPLSIALSIASGAGPLPGLIAGIWATVISSLFGGSNYNIIGAAGALTTILFAASIGAPLGLGAAILPIIALTVGLLILVVWAIGADRFLYYVPSSVMYGFAAGVAVLIAISQLFDATGLSALKRTGHFAGDIELFAHNITHVVPSAAIVFAIALAAILTWKKYIKAIPAVIPVSIAGIIFGYIETNYFAAIDLVSLSDKFGSFAGTLSVPVVWNAIPQILASSEAVRFVLTTSGVVALIAILETLITAKIGDKITHTQSSSRKELFGLALANLGSGVMGGLPATGVFIRTGANIKAGATHRMSAFIAAIATAIIAVIVLPLFRYMPMPIMAAILVNTAIGLIEVHRFKEFWVHERSSFYIAILVVLISVFEDAGVGVVVGAVVSLLLFVDRVSHGRFDAFLNYADGTCTERRGEKILSLHHDSDIQVLTYSIAGYLGYIDGERHAANLRHIAHSKRVDCVVIRLRDLFNLDFEGAEMLADSVEELERSGKRILISSASESIVKKLTKFPRFAIMRERGEICSKTIEALSKVRALETR
jgi:SulP family sulfate permease